MKTERKIAAFRLALFAALAVVASFIFAGCGTPPKMRDVELDGMYVNGYSETLAIGSGRLTSIPGEREALAAHYEEDTAWLHPSIKTHKIDIFMVGSNSTQNAAQILGDICKAFAEVAPGLAEKDAEVAKSVSTTTPLGVVKSGGEVRKAVALAKAATSGRDEARPSQTTSETSASSATSVSSSDCTDGSCERK